MNSKDLDRQIYDAQQRQQQAASAERQRLEAEQANLRAMQTAQAEIAQLEAERAKARFNEAKAGNARIIEGHEAALTVLRATFKEALAVMPGLQEAFHAALESWQAQQDHIDSALAEAQRAAWNDASAPDWMDEARQSHHRETEVRQRIRTAAEQFSNAIHPEDALIDWIGQSDDRQARAGLVAAIVGELFAPTPEYDPQRASDRRTRARHGR